MEYVDVDRTRKLGYDSVLEVASRLIMTEIRCLVDGQT